MGEESEKFLRCVNWLQQQNSDVKKSLQNQNDIQFIIENNANRKKFLLNVAEDEATVPAGVNEPEVGPQIVPVTKLRVNNLRLECEWPSCKKVFSDYRFFQKHVPEHCKELHVAESDGTVQYTCLWDVCGHSSHDYREMVRHMYYHVYHSKLLAIGFNGRATLNLAKCSRDSTKRNKLPPLKFDFKCMWFECEEESFVSIQMYLDHVRHHVNNAEQPVCSWAGCGAVFPKRGVLAVHLKSHTGEKVIACYHCGMRFASNRKLCDHSRRQNVNPNSAYECNVCGVKFATSYLMLQHARQHVSAFACALCDMSAPSAAALATHVRYRHQPPAARCHACPHCGYRAVTRFDLRKHIPTHRKERGGGGCRGRSRRQYACHLCPARRVYSRGERLTAHLVRSHGAQWPCGHSRFRYQISEDGMYRLTTTRYEVLEVSKKIVSGYQDRKESLENSLEFDLRDIAPPTATTPRHFQLSLRSGHEPPEPPKPPASPTLAALSPAVEITMCDVDDKGNIISSEVINDVVYK